MENITKKLNSFKEWFANPHGWLFLNDGDSVYSLSLSSSHLRTDWNGDEIYEITHVGWQDEGIRYGYHTVCATGSGSTTMIYNLTQDLIVRDSWLADKYNDAADGWVSSRLGVFFDNIPHVAKDSRNWKPNKAFYSD